MKKIAPKKNATLKPAIKITESDLKTISGGLVSAKPSCH